MLSMHTFLRKEVFKWRLINYQNYFAVNLVFFSYFEKCYWCQLKHVRCLTCFYRTHTLLNKEIHSVFTKNTHLALFVLTWIVIDMVIFINLLFTKYICPFSNHKSKDVNLTLSPFLHHHHHPLEKRGNIGITPYYCCC